MLVLRPVVLAALPFAFFACAEAKAPDVPPPAPSATTAAPPTASEVTATPSPSGSQSAPAYETCVPGWTSASVHSLRNYPHRALKDIPGDIPANGHFDTEGTVTGGSACPPCPPNAKCKPCEAPYVDLTDGASLPLRVYLTSGAELPSGKKFKDSVVTCAGSTPARYELRGYVPAD